MEFLSVDAIQVLHDVYPRDSFDNEVVNSYALNVEQLPPIVVSKELVLVDGYHRLLAHKLRGKIKIKAEVIECPKERVLWEATKLNAKHGLQLNRYEKRRLARLFYKNNGCTYEEISDVLAVEESTLSNWLRDLVKEAKEEQKQQITQLYLQCLTHQEISDKIGLSRSRITEIVDKFKTEFSDIVPESLQLFNVWNFSNRDKRYGLDFKGAIPGQIIENILYYFTEPFDVVVDPMAGGGTTIDVCKVMYRRYRAYDIKPVRDDIIEWDITHDFPKEAHNCDLIFLDPPYHDMVFDFFETIDDFLDFMRCLARNTWDVIKDGGVVALLMANRDWKDKTYTDLSFDSYLAFRNRGFHTIQRISVPFNTQQFTGFDVERGKKERRMMGLVRDLLIFKKV